MLPVVLSLGGCGLIRETFDSYDGPRLPDSQLAIIQEGLFGGLLDSISKDGQLVWRNDSHHPGRVKLQPGSYEISYSFGCYSQDAAFLTGNDPIISRGSYKLDLLAGHTYSSHGSCRGTWIEDDKSGEVFTAFSIYHMWVN